MMGSCSLSILVARTDIPFMLQTIPHLVKSCGFPFQERVLFVETAPLSGVFRDRPGVGTLEQLRDCCDRLLREGVVDRVVDIDYSEATRQRIYRKHFGRDVRFTHDYRGASVFGFIYSLEALSGDHVLHFDSDMLLHQQDHDWISEGMTLLRSCPDVMFVSPLSGAPRKDGTLHQRQVSYTHDPRGFYAFKVFTSRKFLVRRDRLEQMLPIQPSWVSWKRKLLGRVTGKSSLNVWEIMMSDALQSSKYIRADLSSPQAWTLHTPDHGMAFVEALPDVIQRIETGHYPPDQAGDYDLRLDLWHRSFVQP
jgi:hypothetical protein